MHNERLHIERMLDRALHKKRLADHLVEKWVGRLEALGPAPTAPLHPLLWAEEPEDPERPEESPSTLPLPFEAVSPKEAHHAEP